MATVDDLQSDVQVVLNSIRPYIESISSLRWGPSDGALTIVFRSMLRRQYEALGVTSHLIANWQGFPVPQLLRPACEEFVWAKYLTSIPTAAAEVLVRCVNSKEVRDSLRAQDQCAGRSATRTLGLLPFLEEANNREASELELLRSLASNLDWPPGSRKTGRMPSLKWLAKKTNELDTYELIYHSTSRFVHFSAAELTRGAWYDPNTGATRISYAQFREVHGHLGLYWGLLLLVQTWNEVDEFLDVRVEIDVARITEAVCRIGEAGIPPIITAKELERS